MAKDVRIDESFYKVRDRFAGCLFVSEWDYIPKINRAAVQKENFFDTAAVRLIVT